MVLKKNCCFLPKTLTVLFLKPGCFSLRVVKLHVIFLLISEHVCVFPELRHCLKGKQDDCYEDYNFYGSIHRARRKHGLNYRINPGEFNVVILSSVLTQLLQVNLLLYLYSRKNNNNTGMDNFYKTLKLGSL